MTARRHRHATALERLWAWLCDSPDPRRVDYAAEVREAMAATQREALR